MKAQQYDKVVLKDGREGFVIEVFPDPLPPTPPGYLFELSPHNGSDPISEITDSDIAEVLRKSA